MKKAPLKAGSVSRPSAPQADRSAPSGRSAKGRLKAKPAAVKPASSRSAGLSRSISVPDEPRILRASEKAGPANGTRLVGASGPTLVKGKSSEKFRLADDQLVKIHDTMVKARVLEETLIRMYKKNQGYFWLGGPGEEAFNVPLGHQIKKGQGLDHDFMHFHYRQGATMLVLGMDPMDAMRQMQNVATDPFSGGRNFCSHYSKREWNVVPVTSTIETQYLSAIGTGIAHKRHGGEGITIVTGGDAGTAEGDFASCLVWASRPGFELPMLIIVTNNKWGISTPAGTQHGEKHVADRAKAFGIRSHTCDGLDVEESWFAIREAMEYVRTERKPFLLEADVTRLYGHSSATGANPVTGEEDPITRFESRLAAAGIMSPQEMKTLRGEYEALMLDLSKKVREEPMPDPDSIYDFTYCGQKGKYF